MEFDWYLRQNGHVIKEAGEKILFVVAIYAFFDSL